MAAESFDSTQVFRFIRRSKVVTTRDIAKHFRVRVMQAAGAVAVLRRTEIIEPASPIRDATGDSRWQVA